LGTPVTDDIANAVMAQLLCLQSMDADRQISMYINSPGGSFTASPFAPAASSTAAADAAMPRQIVWTLGRT
jgi:hypothetical protein